jgi:hypothetical protein
MIFPLAWLVKKPKKKKKTNEVSSPVYGLLRAHLVKCINHLEEE